MAGSIVVCLSACGGAGGGTASGGGGNDILWLPSMPSEVTHHGSNLKVMTVGDSITFGVESLTPSGGYRESLRRRSVRPLLFVGSQMRGYSAVENNEGYPGKKIEDLTALIPGKLTTYKPDVILLLAGINDLETGPKHESVGTALQAMQTLIEEIHRVWPMGKLFVSSLVPISSSSSFANHDEILAFNAGLKSIANSSKVVLVDEYDSAGIMDLDLNPDGVHPKDSGYAKIGETWASALNASP